MCLSPSCKAERHVVPVTRKEKRNPSTVLSRWCDEPKQPCYFLHTVSEQGNGTLKDHFSTQQKLTIYIVCFTVKMCSSSHWSLWSTVLHFWSKYSLEITEGMRCKFRQISDSSCGGTDWWSNMSRFQLLHQSATNLYSFVHESFGFPAIKNKK